MTWIIQAILSFLAATGLEFIFNAPRKMLFYCGFVGMTGWLIYSVFNGMSGDPMQASFLGAFMRCPRSTYFCTKRFRTPMIIFSVRWNHSARSGRDGV